MFSILLVSKLSAINLSGSTTGLYSSWDKTLTLLNFLGKESFSAAGVLKSGRAVTRCLWFDRDEKLLICPSYDNGNGIYLFLLLWFCSPKPQPALRVLDLCFVPDELEKSPVVQEVSLCTQGEMHHMELPCTRQISRTGVHVTRV